ncbi:MAG: hypothetical protein MUO76_10245 [Anaerolineaceae bacterium]|nr:hypothetical protein [Anaerolineaceae bacterium]
MLMASEGPTVIAFIARLPGPEINIAAFGSVVDPLRGLTLAPLVMLLSASTALSKDWASYIKLRKFMFAAGAALTLVHFMLAFTPLYYILVEDLMNVPAEIVEVARKGLMIMLPIPWSIGYRRFQQGVMIRFGHSDAIFIGTIIRLVSVLTILLIGYSIGTIPGTILGATALTIGMLMEAIYAGIRIRPILQFQVKTNPAVPLISWRKFTSFYFPLVLTSFMMMIWRPIGSAAISRMPNPLESLAVWPVVAGLVFILQTMGISYNEIVVATLDKPGSTRNLRAFSRYLIIFVSLIFILIAATPFSDFWFRTISALPDHLIPLAMQIIWVVLPAPALSVLLSWFQGAILYGQNTRAIPEAISFFLVTINIVIWSGVAWGKMQGVFIAAVAFTFATSIQVLWLWYRSRNIFMTFQDGDT